MNTTERLIFHATKSDEALAQLWQNCANSAEKLAHLNAHAPAKLPGQEILNRFLKQDKNFKSWLIQNQINKQFIGYLVHGEFFPGLPNSIGYLIGLPFIKQGFATEAVTALLEHLSANGQRETYAYCLASNLASVKTLEKCGFENQGTVHKIGFESLQFKINLI